MDQAPSSDPTPGHVTAGPMSAAADEADPGGWRQGWYRSLPDEAVDALLRACDEFRYWHVVQDYALTYYAPSAAAAAIALDWIYDDQGGYFPAVEHIFVQDTGGRRLDPDPQLPSCQELARLERVRIAELVDHGIVTAESVTLKDIDAPVSAEEVAALFAEYGSHDGLCPPDDEERLMDLVAPPPMPWPILYVPLAADASDLGDPTA